MPCQCNRREFLSHAMKGLIAAGTASMVIGSCTKASDFLTNDSGDSTLKVDLTKAENQPLRNVGGAVYVEYPNDPTAQIIVYRADVNKVTAFTSKCTHQGQRVNLPVDGTVVCPRHGAQFDTTGKWIDSRTITTNLASFEATLDGEMIMIKL